ncbi:MAG: hypothetical protein R3C44_04345 [Chloroflexota bacterium]
MRIGMVSATYDAADVVNGQMRMVDLYRWHLTARGHEVTVFALGRNRQYTRLLVLFALPVYHRVTSGYYAGIGYSSEA